MIQILDNLIPLSAQDRLIEMINSRDFKWSYKSDVTYHPGAGFPEFYIDERSLGYAHSVYYENKVDDAAMLPWCWQILDSMSERTGIKVEKLLRIQINLMYQNPSKTYTTNSWNAAHTDQNFEHKVLLYYVDNSDGDTFLFNESKRDELFKEFTVKDRVTPTKGTGVLFDGHRFHASSNPIKSTKRFAININFL
jgi:hypothetical protein